MKPAMSVTELVDFMGQTSFEARNLWRGAKLFQRMVEGGDTIWLGIAGAGIAGGMGGMVMNLLEKGFIDVICSTGAQVYHDLHFAFALPVKSISPHWNDDQLRTHGDTRIYDIGIREEETLQAQDEIIRKFIIDSYEILKAHPITSWEFNFHMGQWVLKNAPHPEKSFVAQAAKLKVPIFWDSFTNHSIAMNVTRTDLEGYPITFSPQQDIWDSAALVYATGGTGFVELGGGGPKNFIQQTGPTISQILEIDFEGADRGLQIGTAVEREGSLSSCTFGEAVTWGKYKEADEAQLVQIWAEYSLVFPLLTAYVLDSCSNRKPRLLADDIPQFRKQLKEAR